MQARNGIGDFSREDYQRILEYSLDAARRSCAAIKAMAAVCPLEEIEVVHDVGEDVERLMLDLESAIEFFKKPECGVDETRRRWLKLQKPDPTSGGWRYLPQESKPFLYDIAGRIVELQENAKGGK